MARVGQVSKNLTMYLVQVTETDHSILLHMLGVCRSFSESSQSVLLEYLYLLDVFNLVFIGRFQLDVFN